MVAASTVQFGGRFELAIEGDEGSRVSALLLRRGLVLGVVMAAWAIVGAAEAGRAGLLASFLAISFGVLLASLIVRLTDLRDGSQHHMLAIVAAVIVGGLVLSRLLQDMSDTTVPTALAFSVGFVITFLVACAARAADDGRERATFQRNRGARCLTPLPGRIAAPHHSRTAPA